MALIRWRPMRGDLQRFDRDFMHDMDRYFDEARSWWEGAGELRAWNPNVNVYEKDDRIVVEAEMPGLKKEEIDVSVQDHILTLSGERKQEHETKEKNYYRRERVEGSFCRSIGLPTSVDSENIEASYESGILTLKIPKAEEAKAKRIEIH